MLKHYAYMYVYSYREKSCACGYSSASKYKSWYQFAKAGLVQKDFM